MPLRLYMLFSLSLAVYTSILTVRASDVPCADTLLPIIFLPFPAMSTVPNDQLKPHLLRKVVHLMMIEMRDQVRQKAFAHWTRRGFPIPARARHVKYVLRNLTFMANLLVSGKESADVVRMLLSQRLDSEYTVYVSLCDDSFECEIRPAYLKMLALRWTRFFDIKDYITSRQLSTLRIHNNIEKLSLVSTEPTTVAEKRSSPNVKVVEACPSLSTLIYPPEVLVSVLKYAKHPFSELHTIEMAESQYDLSQIFTLLTEHPEQCPVLDTLTI